MKKRFFGMKNIALVVLATLVAQSVAVAAPVEATPSPEQVLLGTAIAARGMKLSQSDAQSLIQSAVTTYLQTSQPDNREERLAQAMVDLKIETPAQAQQFVQDAQDQAPTSDPDQLKAELEKLTALHPEGAQFSVCDGIGIGLLGAFVGGLCMLPGQTVGSSQSNTGETIAVISFVGLLFLALGTDGCAD